MFLDNQDYDFWGYWPPVKRLLYFACPSHADKYSYIKPLPDALVCIFHWLPAYGSFFFLLDLRIGVRWWGFDCTYYHTLPHFPWSSSVNFHTGHVHLKIRSEGGGDPDRTPPNGKSVILVDGTDYSQHVGFILLVTYCRFVSPPLKLSCCTCCISVSWEGLMRAETV